MSFIAEAEKKYLQSLPSSEARDEALRELEAQQQIEAEQARLQLLKPPEPKPPAPQPPKPKPQPIEWRLVVLMWLWAFQSFLDGTRAIRSETVCFKISQYSLYRRCLHGDGAVIDGSAGILVGVILGLAPFAQGRLWVKVALTVLALGFVMLMVARVAGVGLPWK